MEFELGILIVVVVFVLVLAGFGGYGLIRWLLRCTRRTRCGVETVQRLPAQDV